MTDTRRFISLPSCFTTVILFWVSVPVLSEQITCVQPSVSTAVSFRITAFRFDILVTPIDAIELYRDFFADFSEEKAGAMLADLAIGPKDKLSAMSKGTLEKLYLALTMSRRAKLYLLDEPIGGVDPAARDYILSTIIRNYAEDAALVLSTHLIGDIENVLDDALFLQNGRVALAGSVDTLREENGKSVDALFREVFKCSGSY